ncbi:MAG: protein-arginine kinase activator protein McsA, partial [Patescibacteria group bacterium]
SDVRDAEFEMAYAVRTEDYEDAAECRDKIEGIRQKVGFYD